MIDPRFDYRKYITKSVSSERLDQLADFVFAEKPVGMWASIVAGLKLLVAAFYVIAREKIVTAELQVKKQEYEQEHSGSNQEQIDHDDLSSQPRPGSR